MYAGHSLNQWQAEHREMLDQQHQNLTSLLNQLSSLNTVYNESVQRLEKVAAEMDSIDGSLSSITLSGESMEKITRELHSQNRSLEASLQEIARTGEQAKNAIPAISEGFSLRECPAYILLYKFSPKDTGQSKVK